MNDNSANAASIPNQAEMAMHAYIKGRVQGVGFRYFVQRSGETLGLVGWVRNTYEGHVEVWAEGNKAALSKLIGILHKGPPSAVVLSVKVDWEPPYGTLTRFSVRGTS